MPSNASPLAASIATKSVMAEQIAHDVVKEAQSMAAPPTIDDIAKSSTSDAAGLGQANEIPLVNDRESTNTPSSQLLETSAASPSFEPVGLRRDLSKSPLGDKSLHAEASGGSDTDTSRADGAEHGKSASGHARTNSVKKPTTFKSVSVTKNFLKAAAGSSTARPGEKVTPTGSSAPSPVQNAKPRLVAKSTLGGLGSRSGLSTTTVSGSGPDASKVWNKNRPIQPAPPRQYTDEELKQQYGIHMATRLSADEAGKESKWADIDDDEDDWAPETVEWMDGTKSTVAPAEPQGPSPAPPDDPKSLEEAAKPVLTSMQKSGSLSNKTILKPGVAATLAKAGESGSKSGSEKTLTNKLPAPVPSKSPWATLPPVDKISPVTINPTLQQSSPQGRFGRDPNGFDAIPPLPSPKEIPADEFNRTWQAEPPNRTLYNPQSSRFESVQDARRGSRHEQGQRQPALLQRPGQVQPNPAEPSAAFQTSRSTGEGTWTRHRAGSNVSAGSGGRRTSFSRPHDAHHDRLEGMSPSSGSFNGSPQLRHAYPDRFASAPHGQRWSRQSPVATHAQLDTSAIQDAQVNGSIPDETPEGQEQEDPVAVQQRLMREKIEKARAAKQRQLEAEEREEAERKERLRRKVEELAGATPSPSLPEGKEVSALAVSEGKEVKPVSLSGLGHGPTAGNKPPSTSAISSPPKPPIPTHQGEVAQYGLMKVHQPQPMKKANLSEQALLSRHGHAEGHHGPGRLHSQNYTHDRGQYQSTDVQQPLQRLGQSQKITDSQAAKISDNGQKGGAFGESSAAAWKSAAASTDAYGGWSAGGTLNSKNVWSFSQSKEKALGNGTFDTNFGREDRFSDNRARDSSGSIVGNSNNRRISSQAPEPIGPPLSKAPLASNSSSSFHSTSHTQPLQLSHTQQTSSSRFFSKAQPTSQSSANQAPQATLPPHDGFNSTSQQSSNKMFPLSSSADFMAAVRSGSGKKYNVNDWSPENILAVDRTRASINAAKVAEHQKAYDEHGPSSSFSVTNVLTDENGKRIMTSDARYDSIGPDRVNASAIAKPAQEKKHPGHFGNTGKSAMELSSPPPASSSLEDTREINVQVKLPRARPNVKLPPAAANQSSPPVPRAASSVKFPNHAAASVNALERVQAIIKDMQTNKIAVTSRIPLDVTARYGETTVSIPITQPGASLDIHTKEFDEVLFEAPEFGSTPIVRVSKAPVGVKNPDDIAALKNSPHIKKDGTIANYAWAEVDPKSKTMHDVTLAPIDGQDDDSHARVNLKATTSSSFLALVSGARTRSGARYNNANPRPNNNGRNNGHRTASRNVTPFNGGRGGAPHNSGRSVSNRSHGHNGGGRSASHSGGRNIHPGSGRNPSSGGNGSSALSQTSASGVTGTGRGRGTYSFVPMESSDWRQSQV